MSIRRVMALLLTVLVAITTTRLADGRGWSSVEDLVVFMTCLVLGMVVLHVAAKWLAREGLTEKDVPSFALGVRRVIGAFTALICPHSGFCLRCNMPWEITRPHLTDVSIAAGSFFAICEPCFRQTQPEERLRYYYMRMGRQAAGEYRPTYGPIRPGHKHICNLDAEAVRQAVYREARTVAPDPEWEEGVA